MLILFPLPTVLPALTMMETPWNEQPMYFQLAFALDRVKAMAPKHPEWKMKQPFKELIEGDMKTALAGGEKALMEIVMTTHAGMTTEEFEKTVNDWMATATHPKTGKQYGPFHHLQLLNNERIKQRVETFKGSNLAVVTTMTKVIVSRLNDFFICLSNLPYYLVIAYQ